MYKDVLQKLNTDRIVDSNFILRLEKNGFEVNYQKYSFWDNQPYVKIGKKVVWLIEETTYNNSTSVKYRYRNAICEDIKNYLQIEQQQLVEEIKLINQVLPKI